MYIPVAKTNGPLVLAGDNVCAWENLEGWNNNGVLHPVGLVVGSNRDATHLLATVLDDADGRTRRAIPVHQNRHRDDYLRKAASNGAMTSEVALAPGDTSRPWDRSQSRSRHIMGGRAGHERGASLETPRHC